jgi:hypothetical protein
MEQRNEFYFRPEVPRHLKNRIRLAANIAEMPEREWLGKKIAEVLNKEKPEKVLKCPT